jgi:hypothetical protein
MLDPVSFYHDISIFSHFSIFIFLEGVAGICAILFIVYFEDLNIVNPQPPRVE